jgi:hypothetical protein
MLEVWKEIIGFENLYQVSNLGNVRSLGNGGSYKNKGRVKLLSLPISGNGYRNVIFNVNKKYNNNLVHRLVAQAFVPNPNNLPQVNHIDGCKINNFFENLQWCTAKENTIHAHKIKLTTPSKGEINGMSKLKQYQVDEIRGKYIPRVYTHQKLADEYNVSTTAICQIINFKYWK